jgi:beta-1,4-mannosyl-glycoprotein beta-1,4-N-acetylglucosaminyltransferase
MPPGARESDHWHRENHQRNALVAGLDDASPDDIVLLSDADEIPRAGSVRSAIEFSGDAATVHCFELAMYAYFLNFRYEKSWLRNGPRLVRRRFLRSMQSLRDVHPPTANPLQSISRWLSASVGMRRPIRRVVHADAGWHFSSMGGVDMVTEKFSSFCHIIPERHSNPEGNVRDMAKARIEAARNDPDLCRVAIDANFPAYLVDNQPRFARLIDYD